MADKRSSEELRGLTVEDGRKGSSPRRADLRERSEQTHVCGWLTTRLRKTIFAVSGLAVCLTLSVIIVSAVRRVLEVQFSGFPYSTFAILGLAGCMSGMLGLVLWSVTRKLEYASVGCLLASALCFAGASEAWAYPYPNQPNLFSICYDANYPIPWAVTYCIASLFFGLAGFVAMPPLILAAVRMAWRLVRPIVQPIPLWAAWTVAISAAVALFVGGHLYVEHSHNGALWGDVERAGGSVSYVMWQQNKHRLINVMVVLVIAAIPLVVSAAKALGDAVSSTRVPCVSVFGGRLRAVLFLALLALCGHELFANDYFRSSVTTGVLFMVLSLGCVLIPFRASATLPLIVVTAIGIGFNSFALPRHEARRIQDRFYKARGQSPSPLLKGPKEPRLYLMDMLISEPDRGDRGSTCEALLRNVSDPDVEIRQAAVTALVPTDFEDAECVVRAATDPRLIRACYDSDALVRRLAAKKICSWIANSVPDLFPDYSAGDIPTEWLSPTARRVRHLQSRGELVKIARNQTNSSSEQRNLASPLHGLLNTKSREYTYTYYSIRRLRNDVEDDDRSRSAYALAVMGESESAVLTLTGILLGMHKDDEIGVGALQYLGAMGPEARSAVPCLIDAWARADDTLSSRFPDCLKRITGRDFRADRRQWTRWWQQTEHAKQ